MWRSWCALLLVEQELGLTSKVCWGITKASHRIGRDVCRVQVPANANRRSSSSSLETEVDANDEAGGDGVRRRIILRFGFLDM